MNRQIIEKLTDKEFTEKIIGLKTKDDVKKAFKAEKIKISDKQLDELGRNIHEIVEEMSKLPPEELEKIAGGTKYFGGLIDNTRTWGDAAYHAAEQPGFVQVLISSVLGLVIAGINAGTAVYKSHNTPPPPQPVISDKALAGGAIVLAVLGGGYVINQLVKSGWFSEESSKITKK